MSEENKTDLSPKDKATEAMLRSVALPESAVNRDVLMYEAGFAAGIASFDGKTSVGLAQSKKNDVIWSALTATFAATAAVCLAMLFLQEEEPPKDLMPSGVVVASSDKANTVESTVEAAIELAPRGNPVESFFGFLPERRYRDRISNVIRELETVAPVSWDAGGDSLEKPDPLTPGKSVNVEGMIDGFF